jgi:hypothetical protein
MNQQSLQLINSIPDYTVAALRGISNLTGFPTLQLSGITWNLSTACWCNSAWTGTKWRERRNARTDRCRVEQTWGFQHAPSIWVLSAFRHLHFAPTRCSLSSFQKFRRCNLIQIESVPLWSSCSLITQRLHSRYLMLHPPFWNLSFMRCWYNPWSSHFLLCGGALQGLHINHAMN